MERKLNPDKFFESLKSLYNELNSKLKKKYNRNLPFQDVVFDRWDRAKALGFGKGTSIYNSSYVFGNVDVGENTWIGPNTILDGSGFLLKIGNNCSISSGVQIYTHDTVLWALSGGKIDKVTKNVTVGNNVYIGSSSVVLAGVEIGSESVIGANSLVNKHVPTRTIVGGSPAKKIGSVVGYGEKIRLKFD